ncbi:MAG: hypothetical protein JNJ59_05435, partial [Deltaproteobacteria bacterium]|nr:hypothetical protein [Deltaproteobacteria bacterium]
MARIQSTPARKRKPDAQRHPAVRVQVHAVASRGDAVHHAPMRASLVGLVVVLVGCDASMGAADVADTARDTSLPDLAEPDSDAPDTRADDAEADVADTADVADIGEVDEVADVADVADITDVAETDVADTADATDAVDPRPPAILLTVAAIPAEMNGSRPARTPTGDLPFRLRVNRARVDLDVVA